MKRTVQITVWTLYVIERFVGLNVGRADKIFTNRRGLPIPTSTLIESMNFIENVLYHLVAVGD